MLSPGGDGNTIKQLTDLNDLLSVSFESCDNLKVSPVYPCPNYRAIRLLVDVVLTRLPCETTRVILDQPNLMLSKLDKGSAWLLLNRNGYGEKMTAILANDSKFT